jgi:hypothetical protein
VVIIRVNICTFIWSAYVFAVLEYVNIAEPELNICGLELSKYT